MAFSLVGENIEVYLSVGVLVAHEEAVVTRLENTDNYRKQSVVV